MNETLEILPQYQFVTRRLDLLQIIRIDDVDNTVILTEVGNGIFTYVYDKDALEIVEIHTPAGTILAGKDFSQEEINELSIVSVMDGKGGVVWDEMVGFAATCECGKDKFDFMFHSMWCPLYENNI